MKNTAGDCQAAGGAKPPKSINRQHNSIKKETKVSLKSTIMLPMKKYNRLTSEQRYAIYLGLKDGTSKKDIALRRGVV
jgi:DNA-binding NarL/FixJ family response regulator